MTVLPVVLLHGIGGGARGFAPEVAALTARGYRAMAWDQPGYGDSPLPPTSDWAEVVAAFIAFLDGHGLDRVTLIGHSMGGMLAQEVVARHPERVGRLVLAGTSPAFGGDSAAWRQKFLAGRGGARSTPDRAWRHWPRPWSPAWSGPIPIPTAWRGPSPA